MSPIRSLRSLGNFRSPPSSRSSSGTEGVSVACEGVATYKVGTYYEQTQSPSYSSWKSVLVTPQTLVEAR